MDEAKTLRWLHFSDIHVGMGEQVRLWPRSSTVLLDDLETAHRKTDGFDLLVFSGDLAFKGSADEFDRFDQILARILVCNAASNPYYGPLSGIGDDQFRKVFENNILANHWLTQMVAPGMRERGNGSIVVVSSLGAVLGSVNLGAYNVSKAADLQLVRNLAMELGPDGVRVNAIAPGVIRTDFAKALYEQPEREATLTRATPLGRLGEPIEVAGAAVFFASPASHHVTGQYLIVDGGMSIAGAL